LQFAFGLNTKEDVKNTAGEWGRTAVAWLAAGVALFHVWANTFGNLSDLWRNSLHLGLLGLLGFILYPAFGRNKIAEKLYPWGLIPGCLIFMAGL